MAVNTMGDVARDSERRRFIRRYGYEPSDADLTTSAADGQTTPTVSTTAPVTTPPTSGIVSRERFNPRTGEIVTRSGGNGTMPVTAPVTGPVSPPTPPTTTPPRTTPPPVVPPAVYGTTPRTDMGSGAGSSQYAYTGFNFDQDPNNRLIGKSAKYTLADATRQAAEEGAGDIWKTKAGAQIFAEKYIQPKLEAAGFEVLDIAGDKILVRDHADRAAGNPGHWIDWVVNADGANPAIAWQVQEELTDQASFNRSGTFKPTNTTPTPPTDPNADPASGLSPDEEAYRLLAARHPSMGDVARGKREST